MTVKRGFQQSHVTQNHRFITRVFFTQKKERTAIFIEHTNIWDCRIKTFEFYNIYCWNEIYLKEE